ncbi:MULTISPECIES: 2-oxoacid:acceptor oxidoreductase family protein [unclassified Archaeoglobus]|jgi:pyruvate ferredoxin oxidoreductase gamma subunit|uniref:2-oxoacid:acceptor oxidoreductase family protein n=1 Tax=unclassified Archaeoglobus TaxID=2643606 RepID=UPI0025BCBE25|nr:MULTISPECIES: 2-oxoacid:acceptor oxidoreductase family protein [unclassified Archaeoglobus]
MEIRIHGRGGQGVVTMSKIIAEAANLEGYFSQSMPFYGAERRGAPVVSFTRISEDPIYRTSQVYYPDILIVLDPILINFPEVFSGLGESSIAVLNSGSSADVAKKVVFVDATRIAIEHGLVVAGMPVPNVPMLGALLSSEIPISYKTMLEVVQKHFGADERIVSSFNEGYKGARRKTCRFTKMHFGHKGVMECEIPISTPSKGVAGRTGLWRVVKPVVDSERCNGCMSCWLHCPEGVIVETEEGIEIDYAYCKGCMICSSVCPKNAIKHESEMGVVQHAH